VFSLHENEQDAPVGRTCGSAGLASLATGTPPMPGNASRVSSGTSVAYGHGEKSWR